MDLDNIKKTWQQAEIKPGIGEDKIRLMLNKGGGALDKLKKTEKVFFWLLIPCLFAGVMFYRMHWLPGVLYTALVVFGFFWQRYKMRFLDSINLSEMTVMETTKAITRYKKYLIREIISGFVFIPVFFWAYTFFGMKRMLKGVQSSLIPDTSHLLIMFAVLVVITLVLCLLIYLLLYMKNVKKLEATVREVEDFEKDNV